MCEVRDADALPQPGRRPRELRTPVQLAGKPLVGRVQIRIARKLEEDARQVLQGYRKPKQTHLKHRDRPYAEVVLLHIDWGKLNGRKDGKPWSEYHASRKKLHLDLWGETLELKTLADLDNLLPRVRATLQELAGRGKAPKTLANVAEAISSFCRWCVINKYLAIQRINTSV